LVVEGLSREIMETKMRDNVQDIKIDSILSTHLLFVDDSILEWLRGRNQKLREILNILFVATRMEVNAQKSIYSL
jgi:hypothetical protein